MRAMDTIHFEMTEDFKFSEEHQLIIDDKKKKRESIKIVLQQIN